MVRGPILGWFFKVASIVPRCHLWLLEACRRFIKHIWILQTLLGATDDIWGQLEQLWKITPKLDRGPHYCKGAKMAKNSRIQQILPSPRLFGELESQKVHEMGKYYQKCVQQPLIDLRKHYGPLIMCSLVDFYKSPKKVPGCRFWGGVKKKTPPF